MNALAPIAALAALGFAASASAANDLQTRVTASDGWVAYRVPMVAGVEGPCCYAVLGSAAAQKGCNLDRRNWNSGTNGDESAIALDGTLAVYLRVEHGRVERVRAVAASCPVQTASTVRWLDPVEPANSIAMLSSLLDSKTSGDPDDRGLVALAYHAGRPCDAFRCRLPSQRCSDWRSSSSSATSRRSTSPCCSVRQAV